MGEVKGWSYNLLLKTWNVNVAIRVAKSGLCFLTSFFGGLQVEKRYLCTEVMEQVIGSVSACLTVQRLPGKSVKIYTG